MASIKSVCLLLTAIALVHSGICLKCNLCLGSRTSDCARGIPGSMAYFDCNPDSLTTPILKSHMVYNSGEMRSDVIAVCTELIVIATNATGPLERPIAERGCAIIKASDDFCELVKKVATVKLCKSCNTDLCNL